MQTFRKEERLCSKRRIQELFSKGLVFQIMPFRIIWLDAEFKNTFPAQLLISVPKRKFKKAAERNSIKRLIREAYRKNKHLLYSSLELKNKQCIFMIIYIGYHIISYREFEAKIVLILQYLAEMYEERTG